MLAVNIVLADAQATPVNHNFIPMGKDQNGLYWFEDQSASSALGYNRISIEVKRPLPAPAGGKSTSDRLARVYIGIHCPTLETLGTADNGLTPPPTISHIERSRQEYIMPEKGSKLERQHLRKYNKGIIDNSLVIAAIEDLQSIYG